MARANLKVTGELVEAFQGAQDNALRWLCVKIVDEELPVS